MSQLVIGILIGISIVGMPLIFLLYKNWKKIKELNSFINVIDKKTDALRLLHEKIHSNNRELRKKLEAFIKRSEN